MKEFKYLIVGAGMTADAATEGIREVDATGSIGMIGAEPDPPYDRPPLSKKLWFGDPFDSIWRKTADRNVEIFTGRRVTLVSPEERTVTDDRQTQYRYDKLLLATGGVPRRFDFGNGLITYFRTVQDYLHVRQQADGKHRFAVIGGGFIGSEMAAALATVKQHVVLVMPSPGVCSRVFPAELSNSVTNRFREKGIEVLAGETLRGVRRDGDRLVIALESGTNVEVDEVIAGIGIEPDVTLARQAGLTVNNGVVVDELLRTSRPDIFAAGDVAEFFSPLLGKRLRLEHEDNANKMGKQAGRNMAGAGEPFHHLSLFYSDLFEDGYEAVGDVDARLETVVDWLEPTRRGAIYYLDKARVRGVLLWNIWKKIPAARRLIARPAPVTSGDLVGRWLVDQEPARTTAGQSKESR